jgi:hypothetical protein
VNVPDHLDNPGLVHTKATARTRNVDRDLSLVHLRIAVKAARRPSSVFLLLALCTSCSHMEPLQPRPLVVLKKTASSTSLASKEDSTDSARFSRKFGKHIQKRQLDIPEYAASFVDYKALKKVCSSSTKSGAAIDQI